MGVNKKIIGIILFLLAILSGGLVYAQVTNFNVGLAVITSPVTAYVKWIAPQGRVGADGTNWDTLYYIKVKAAGGGSTLFTMSTLSSTDNLGRDLTPIEFTGLSAGTYDIYVKGHQSLTKKMSNVVLAEGLNRLNFTQADNSVATGTVRLLAGDISGATSSPSAMGDNVVNSVDLGILIDHLDQNDSTGNAVRANLNQDPAVNSVDLSLLIDNLDKNGD